MARKIIKWGVNLIGVIGAFLMYGGISTLDFYNLEIGQPVPNSAWACIAIGGIMVVISSARLFAEKIKEMEE